MLQELLALAALILLGKLLEELATRKGYPPLIGWALAGILLGPSLLGFAEPTPEILFFASIGVYIFFFLIGLEEVDVEGILSTVNLHSIAAPIAATVLHVLAAAPIGILAGLDLEESLALAVIAALPTSSVVAKTLSDLGLLRKRTGITVFSYTLAGEFVGLLLATALLELSSAGGFTVRTLTYQLGEMILYFALAGWASVYIVPKLVKAVRLYMLSSGALVGVILGLLLLFVGLGEMLGVHGVVGSLLLGLVLSDALLEKEAAGALEAIKKIGEGFFIPLFFAAIGLRLSPSGPIDPLMATLLVAELVPMRMAIHYLVAKATGLPALEIAAAVMARGAVDLAILGPFLDAGLVDKGSYAVVVATSIAMLVIYPLAAKKMLGRGAGEEPEKVPLLPLLARHVLGMMKVRDVMEEPLFLDRDSTAGEARRLMAEHGVDVAVVETEKGPGLVYMAELAGADPGEPLERYVHRPRVVARPDDSLYHVLEEESIKQEYGAVVVEEGRVVGVVDPKAVLRRIVSPAPGGNRKE